VTRSSGNGAAADKQSAAAFTQLYRDHVDHMARFAQAFMRTINLCKKIDVARLAFAEKTNLQSRIRAAAARL